MNTDEGDPDLAQYGLTAKYGDDQTDIKISEPLAIGKPYGLPFADSFKNGNTGNFWWADCASNDDYGLLTDAMLTSSDGDNGCFGFIPQDSAGRRGESRGDILTIYQPAGRCAADA